MQDQSFSITFLVDPSPTVVFNAVNNVRGWWSETLEGQSAKLNDEFSYRHGDIHYSKHKLTEVVPNEKVVWLTLNSKLTFANPQNEWNGTHVIFDISKEGEQTRLTITHQGLIPAFECYGSCSKGWTYYLQNSLLPLITTGTGKPDKTIDK